MNRTLLIITAGLALCLNASADIVAQWTFNDSDGVSKTGTFFPAIATGSSFMAQAVGGLATSDFNAASGSSDPAGASIDNNRWRLIGFPAQGTANKTAGPQFTVDTTGYKDITMSWDQININVGSRYWRIQYSVDNGSTWVDKDVITNTVGSTWINPIATVSFVGITGANENPTFEVQLVAEWESTAIGTANANYAAVVGTSTYTPATANCGLDMVTFRGALDAASLLITTNPVSQVVAAGQPASFNVSAAGGSGTITYQWRKNSSSLGSSATTTAYNIAAAQLTDAGSYDVVLTQGSTTLTSAVATLTVRTPANLAWTGQSGTTWNTNDLSWQDTNSLATVAYTGGDNVLFDSLGAAAPTVSLVGSLNPSSVTVNASSDYTFRTDGGGKVVGTTGLRKQGTGTLVVDTDNTYTGPTVIEAGVLQLGQADAHGSLGTGPITNNGALVFNRTDIVILTNTIAGSGSITNSSTLTLAVANTYYGVLAVNVNSFALSANSTINSPDVIVRASTAAGPSGATKFAINGAQVGAGTTIHLTGLNGPADYRATFQCLSGSNNLNGPLVLEGTGSGAVQTEGNNTRTYLNGNVSGAAGFTGAFFLRGGNGTGFLNGTINLPGSVVNKADSSTWIINSTGNAWALTSVGSGVLRLGAHNALPTSLTLLIGGTSTATFDLAGFNQQLGNLGDLGSTEIITNSSATADSTLTLMNGSFSGTIADSATGGKISLTINGDTHLGGFTPYRGNTTVSGGTLYLTGAGDLPNSPVIDLAGGAVDVSTRNDGTLNVYATQTLKGNGTLAVNGVLVNNGTVELKVNKAGNTVSNDKLAVSSVLSCGGTLKLDLSGPPLNTLDILPVFQAGAGYSGTLPVIDPPVPAPGATWDTSTLLSDGTLRIQGPPVITNSVLSGSSLSMSGGGGAAVALATFSVVTSTNVAAAPAAWTPAQTGSFDASGNFSVTVPFTAGQRQQFFKLKTP